MNIIILSNNITNQTLNTASEWRRQCQNFDSKKNTFGFSRIRVECD